MKRLKETKSDRGVSPLIGLLLVVFILIMISLIVISTFAFMTTLNIDESVDRPLIDIQEKGNGEYVVKVTRMNDADTVRVKAGDDEYVELDNSGEEAYVYLEKGDELTIIGMYDSETAVLHLRQQFSEGAENTTVSTAR